MLQWSHAQPNVETLQQLGGFLGQTGLQWSHAQPNVETCKIILSVFFGTMLQWSHAQPNVETRSDCSLRRQMLKASMEPRSAERGNFETVRAQFFLPIASMEPRSAERGNIHKEPKNYLLRISLQWSHAQPNVETTFARHFDVIIPAQLQWSHAQPNVETARNESACNRGGRSFNGATLSRTWKPL